MRTIVKLLALKRTVGAVRHWSNVTTTTVQCLDLRRTGEFIGVC